MASLKGKKKKEKERGGGDWGGERKEWRKKEVSRMKLENSIMNRK